MTKKYVILSAAMAAAMSSNYALAVDGLSANAGIVSDYYFRGVQQTASASANGGVDYEHSSGLYVGIWAADVEGQADPAAICGGPCGIEIDTYAGYAGEAGDFGYSVGFTHYGYTGGFDSSYDEINLGASYGGFGIDIASGSHEHPGGTDGDYTFMALSYGAGPLSVTYGTFGSDWDGAYLEVGLSTDIGGADAGISFINGDPEENPPATSDGNTTDGTAVVFSLSKSFDL